MFFGLTNSPVTFQSMMDSIFGDLIRSDKIIVYLDDILIFSDDLEEHYNTTMEVLRRLRKHKLMLKAEKCKFDQTSIDFLGIVVGNGHVSMDLEKTKAVREWRTPRNLKESRSFMQFCNYYRTFIPNFAAVTVPLNDLTRKDTPSVWGDRQQAAFDALKKAIADNVILTLPVPGAKFRVETDASNYAVGGVLHQIIDSKARPLAFFSKTLLPEQRRYHVADQELLAIVLTLQHFRHFLQNGPKFDISTDHKNLQYFREPQKLNARQARWATDLAEYDFDLYHRPGSLNIVADTLSRKDKPEGGGVETANSILLPPSRFADMRRLSFRDEEEILKEIRRNRQKIDNKVIVGLKDNRTKDYKDTNGIITYKGLIYVPHNQLLRERILYLHHNMPLAGHPGRSKTVELIQHTYWWPGLSGYTARYVRACEVCQRTKPRVGAIPAPLQPNEAPTKPWQIVSIDVIGPLPESSGYDAILVIVDRLTKMVIAVPTNQELSAEGTARILCNRVFTIYGIPEKIISDRGTQFVSNFMTEFYRMMEIEGNPSTC